MHNHQMQQNFWLQDPFRWFGNANSFIQNFSHPLLETIAPFQVDNAHASMATQLSISKITQTPEVNRDHNPDGTSNYPLQQSGTLSMPKETEFTRTRVDYERKPAPHLFDSIGKISKD